jgi:DNA-nicking Smr family endonuclease
VAIEAVIMSGQEGKPRPRKLSEAEHALWDRVARSVAPLARGLAPAPPAPSTAPQTKPLPAARAGAAAHDAAGAAKPAPPLEPLARRQKQRLARGIQPIDARIDLHGKSQSQAHTALLRFLRKAQGSGAKFVLVITGKGARRGRDRDEPGVLKRQVPQWLSLPELRRYVVGFEPAGIGHGGEGALYVRLRKPANADG